MKPTDPTAPAGSAAQDDENLRRRERRPAAHRDATTGQLLTIPATVTELGIGKDSVYALIARGELVSITIGKARRVLRSSIGDYIARQVQAQHGPVARPVAPTSTTRPARRRLTTATADKQAKQAGV